MVNLIKQLKNIFKALICILIIFLSSFQFIYEYNHIETKNTSHLDLNTSANELVLHDKLHCFHDGNLSLTLNNIEFEYSYNYLITLTLETDHHGCKMNIKLIDPEGDFYYIFNSPEVMRYDAEQTTKYGAVLTGFHSLIFQKTMGPNVNIRIKIEQVERCLEYTTHTDGSYMVKFDQRIYYDVIKVSKLVSARSYSWIRFLQTDHTYRFYIGRVSPVAINLDSETRIYYNITSPSGVLYQIWELWPDGEWQNFTMPDAHNHLTFPFGTVGTGDYILDFAFEQEPPHVNIGIIIADLGSASDQIDSQINDTTTPSDNNSSNNDAGPIISYLIPPEAYLGMGIFASMLIVAVMILIVKNKYKSDN
ncbi:MAG: hypothetical protein GF317_09980 [Candidatus Lokiarchaeota archaeon]|nr:hypothetical protein [Candidatus Lokiarchaeota archaeon]MBD3200004.1 hypothetical protein [Candidatus Lokiarchaeota archaeon]